MEGDTGVHLALIWAGSVPDPASSLGGWQKEGWGADSTESIRLHRSYAADTLQRGTINKDIIPPA